jgi:transcriptional repressor NF-X1
VRHFVRQAPRLRLPQVHAAVSWRLVWPVCEYVRQAEEELVCFIVAIKRVQGADAQSSLPELHPCTQPCHAPSSCPELEPCMATVTLTCPCGRIKQASPCGRSATNPLGRAGAAAANIKCSNECAIAKRNARLAEALGISADRQEGKSVNYADDLMAFARANQKFCLLAEKTFAE